MDKKEKQAMYKFLLKNFWLRFVLIFLLGLFLLIGIKRVRDEKLEKPIIFDYPNQEDR